MALFKWRDRDASTPEETESVSVIDSEESSPFAENAEKTVPPVSKEPVPLSPPSDLSSEQALLDMVSKLVKPSSTRKDSSTQADGYSASDPSKSGDSPSPIAFDDDDLQALESQKSGDPFPPLIESLAPTPDDEELDQLRRIILGREIDGLENIHRQMSDREERIQTLSRIITEAIRLRVLRDDELVGVLKPTVDNIVRNSVRSNPNDLADNLFPVIGPAIRRSISESIRGMLQDFSRTLEKSVSLTGLKWRLEAARTGKPFSEVVLLKTLEYQVEQIFVIHAETGIPIIHMVNPDAHETVKDPDQVAAMLTAIQHFVNDSFAQGELNNLEFGDRNIFVTRAPKVYLACVIRGQAPSNIRIDMQTALELLVMECAAELDSFKGDVKPFTKARHNFEALLTSRFKDENKKLSLRAKMPLIILLALIIGTGGFLGYKQYETNQLEAMVYKKLSIPGLVPLTVTPKLLGRWDIVCLKDELVPPQDRELIYGGLMEDQFRIRYLPYVSQDGQIVYQRLNQILDQKGQRPEGLEEDFDSDNNILYLSGSAPINWFFSNYERLLNVPSLNRLDLSGLTFEYPDNKVSANLTNGIMKFKGEASVVWRENVREQVLKMPGISAVDLQNVNDDTDTLKLKALMSEINGTIILFPVNKAQPVGQDEVKLETAAKKLAELEELATSMDLAASLIVYGHADSTGNQRTNYELSQERAKTLAARLYAEQCRIPISLYGMGDDFAFDKGDPNSKRSADPDKRKIELQVHLNRKGASLALDL